MSAPLSLDLRQRATQSYLNGEGTQKEIAQRFCISVRTLSTWLMLLQAGESLSPLPHSGGCAHAKLQDEHRYALEHWLQEHNDLTLPELCARLLQHFSLQLTPSQLSRRLKQWGWTRKKKRWVMTVDSAPMSWATENGGSGGSSSVW